MGKDELNRRLISLLVEAEVQLTIEAFKVVNAIIQQIIADKRIAGIEEATHSFGQTMIVLVKMYPTGGFEPWLPPTDGKNGGFLWSVANKTIEDQMVAMATS